MQNEGNQNDPMEQNLMNFSKNNFIAHNSFETVNQFTNNFVNNPLIEGFSTFNSNNGVEFTGSTKPLAIVDLCNTRSDDSSIVSGQYEFDLDTIECSIRAGYQEEAPTLSESPTDILNYLNRDFMCDSRQNSDGRGYKIPYNSYNTYLPEQPCSNPNFIPSISSFHLKTAPITPSFCSTPLQTPSDTVMVSSFNPTPFSNPGDTPLSTIAGYPYGSVALYSTPQIPQIPQQLARKIPPLLSTAMLSGAKKAREHIFHEPKKITNRIRNELIQNRTGNEETMRSEIPKYLSPVNFDSRDENLDLAETSDHFDKYLHNPFTNMFTSTPATTNVDFRTPNAYSDNISYFQSTTTSVHINEVNNNWQFNIKMDNDDPLCNGNLNDDDFEFFSYTNLF